MYSLVRRFQLFVKGVVDRCISGMLLVLLAPFVPLIAIAIKIDSRGPVFFNRNRVGKGGREFVMYKFRTMEVDAERRLQDLQHLNAGGQYMIKIKDDPRVTRVGRFLRTSSVDELPQLMNVFKGEMSLIGPRPQAPNEVALYTPEQRRRLAVQPGITGLWQIRARHEPSFDQMVACDLEYIDRWSLALDLMIAGLTIAQILRDTGGLVQKRRLSRA